MHAFWAKGFEACSTADLLQAMQIGRQSLYDTFGDKHTLFVEALELYRREQGGGLRAALEDAASPLDAIRSVLLSIAAESPEDRARGCMMVNTTAECGGEDPQVGRVVAGNARGCVSAFEKAVAAARDAGDLPSSVDPPAAARYLFMSLQGLRVTAKAGTSPKHLREMVAHVLSALRGC